MSYQPKQIRAHVLISGRVQGVGFRWSTQNMAYELGLTGWVKNLRDGRVEAIFEGEEKIVREAVAWCQRGERPARVDDVEISYEVATGEFQGFRVRY